MFNICLTTLFLKWLSLRLIGRKRLVFALIFYLCNVLLRHLLMKDFLVGTTDVWMFINILNISILNNGKWLIQLRLLVLIQNTGRRYCYLDFTISWRFLLLLLVTRSQCGSVVSHDLVMDAIISSQAIAFTIHLLYNYRTDCKLWFTDFFLSLCTRWRMKSTITKIIILTHVWNRCFEIFCRKFHGHWQIYVRL